MERNVGVDLGLRTPHRASVYDDADQRGRPFSVSFNQSSWDGFLHRSTDGADGVANIVLEPTGLVWMAFAAYMAMAGQRVFLVHPVKASRHRKFLSRYDKTDVIDAEALALLRRTDRRMQELTVPTAAQTSLRWMVRSRERLAGEVGGTKLRIEALLEALNPPLLNALGEDKFGRAPRAFLRKYLDPQNVMQLGQKRLATFWSRHAQGHGSDDRAAKVFSACRTTVELYQGLRDNDRLPFSYDEGQHMVNLELDLMEKFEAEIAILDKRIEVAYLEVDPERVLQQLPGIGPVIAPVVQAFAGNITRFRNGRCFVSFCGLAPRKHQSGYADPSMPITKAGHRLLRKYFYLAADVARHHDPQLAAYYARRYQRGDHHNKIIIAIARKLAVRVYAVLMRHAQRTEQSQPKVGYELRTVDGQPIEKKAARELIARDYARAVAAPERDARERKRRGKKPVATGADHEGPSKDAPSATAVPPTAPLIPQNASTEQPKSVTEKSSSTGWSTTRSVLAELAQRLPKGGGKLGG